MSVFEQLQIELRATPRKWLVTGVAGFIGSHLLEALLKLDQVVVGLDNFATGYQRNLDQVRQSVASAQWDRFHLITGNIADPMVCAQACAGVDFVLHQAALGSVPRSLADPVASHQSNVNGCINMLVAARDARVQRFVYASSSAVYGDEPALPKVETRIGKPLSPYAATKLVNEVYADVFARAYGLESIGLRYFNVFGPRQDPEGAYAAVIPKWIAALIQRQPVVINGDGETSRDFCYIDNIVQANLLSTATRDPDAVNQVYNIALGERTTLNQLLQLIREALRTLDPLLPDSRPLYQDFRAGDVQHSLADISKAQRLLGYAPTHRIATGLRVAMAWYQANVAVAAS
jgi:UDP-N-acetylglucosamine 4-epimerase